jgi:hypothetical protein
MSALEKTVDAEQELFMGASQHNGSAGSSAGTPQQRH